MLAPEARSEALVPPRGGARRRLVAALYPMAFLLDTNVVSELRRPRPHGAVLAWLQGVDDADLHLASVTIGEIQAGTGIELTREQDPAKATELQHEQLARLAFWPV